MTELIFLRDSYLKDFKSIVKGVDGERICLDRTAFYARGGGQPCDHGVFRGTGEQDVQVTDVQRQDGLVWHTCAGHAFHEGEQVHGTIDWSRRYALSACMVGCVRINA